jgi:hypothetical protein
MLTAKPTTVAAEVGFSFSCINCERATRRCQVLATIANNENL